MAPKRKASVAHANSSGVNKRVHELPTQDLDGENTGSPGSARFTVPLNNKSIVCDRYGGSSFPRLVFTHGAGGGIEDGPTKDFARGFAEVAPLTCFQGSLNLTSRVKAFDAVADDAKVNVALGGRSMGARAAVLTTIKRSEKPSALVLASYPLTAGRKGETREYERREKILVDIPSSIDVLFIIGSTDPQCKSTDLVAIRESMQARTWLLEIRDADHSLNIKHKDGIQTLRARSGNIAAKWLESHDEQNVYCEIAWDDTVQTVVGGIWTSQPV